MSVCLCALFNYLFKEKMFTYLNVNMLMPFSVFLTREKKLWPKELVLICFFLNFNFKGEILLLPLNLVQLSFIDIASNNHLHNHITLNIKYYN